MRDSSIGKTILVDRLGVAYFKIKSSALFGVNMDFNGLSDHHFAHENES